MWIFDFIGKGKVVNINKECFEQIYNIVINAISSINISSDTIISIFIGGLITWIAAYYYYVQASKDMISKTDELERLSHLIIRGIESNGAEYTRDDNGKPTGLVIKVNIPHGGLELKGFPPTVDNGG